jgi:hypothetical protein
MLCQIAAPAAPAPLAAEADDQMPHPNLTQHVGNHPLQNRLQMLWGGSESAIFRDAAPAKTGYLRFVAFMTARRPQRVAYHFAPSRRGTMNKWARVSSDR